MSAGPDLKEAIDAFQRGDLDRARSIAEREVRAASSAQAQHLLGLIDCRLGKLESGTAWLRKASEAQPANIGFRVMLARALTDASRAKEALEVAARPSGATPAELALWHARAEAADAAGESGIAVEAWGRLCSVGATDWRAWSNYGNALAATGRWSESAQAFKRAVGLNPSELPLRRALASALARAGRPDESANELQHWIELAPADPENRILLARLLADLGRHDESLAQLDKVAQLTTGRDFCEDGDVLIGIASRGGRADIDVNLLRELARLLERTSRIDTLRVLLDKAEALGVERDQLGYPAAAVALRDGEPEEARRLLLADPPDSDPVRWHWLMARIANALDDPATAFAEAEAMNRSVPDYDGWRGRAAKHLDWVRGLAQTMTPAWAKRIEPLDPADHRRLAFLVGFPRSGTTLLDTFMMGHPDVTVLEEVPLIHAVETVLGKIAELPDRSPEELARARAAYFEELESHLPGGFSGLVVDKLPLNLLAAPFLHAVFPDAPIVFAQRHPCDCVLSCFMQGFALNDSMACFLDIGDSADFYDGAMRVWTGARENLPLKAHSLVYESLVGDPEGTLRPLVDFLGLGWREKLLDHCATAKARGAISTPSYDQVVQPLNEKAVGRWRRYEAQLRPVLPQLLPWAERLGYSE
ncbi:MAG TPA: sulfotransferase [Sphingomicrobium sp.]|nr:sulfotransferase [Sphingomicrobium sp.]